jgi:hypothetical protein
MEAEPVNDDPAGSDQRVNDTGAQPKRPPLVTVFTRLAHFSPRTRRWHKSPPVKPADDA